MSDFRRAFRLDRASRSDAHRSVDEELELHLEMVQEELVDAGWSREDARVEALRQFGDMEGTRAYCADLQTKRGRGERRAMTIDELMQDIRYAFRTLRKSPGYASLVVVTLAFGIAANTTIFSVMNPYFFRALPFGDAEELVHVTQVDPVTGWHMDRFSLPIYEDWRDRSRAFEGLAAYGYSGVTLTGPEGPEGTNAGPVTDNMFQVLEADAYLGRTFGPGEGGPGGEPITVLSHGLWQRRYNADPGVLGRTVGIDGVQHTIIGVMPPDFTFPFGGVRLWYPVRDDASAASRSGAPYLLVGRMNPGWTAERVEADLLGIQQELAATYPDADGRWSGVTVLPVRQALNFVWDILVAGFTVLLAAVVLVLMIACVNVASLTLARSGGRVREIAVRAAMGARRGRLVRQLLTESFILAAAGGVLGVLLAYAAAAVIGPVIPEDLYRIGEVSVDRTVLGFSMLLTLATPMLFGLAPALSATRRSLTESLKEGSKGSGGLASTRGRRALVVVQVALAVILTTSAGLMLRSFASVQQLDLGFDQAGLLVASASPPDAEYPGEELTQYVQRGTARLRALPGVEAASATLFVPLNNETSLWQYASPEMSGTPGTEWPTAIANRPYPGYFETMRIPVLAGREFMESDDADAAPVAIVNQAMADRLWPGQDAVGRTVLLGDPDDPTPVAVVGVVGGIRHDGLEGDGSRAQIYRPALQSRFRRHFFVVRTEGDPAALVGPIRSLFLELDANLPVGVRPMTELVRQSQLQWSLGTVFLSIFGAGALLLATLGIYGLVSFAVAQRQRELGVRLALGATRGEIRRVVVGDGVRLTGLGLAIGIVAALALSKVAASTLYGVGPFDPLTIAAVLGLFLGVSALASFLPARRAAKTDPISVLRAE